METLFTFDESSTFYGKQFHLLYIAQTIEATSSQHRSRNRRKISDNYELENDYVSSCYLGSMLNEIEDSLDFTKFDESFSAMDSEKMWMLKNVKKKPKIEHALIELMKKYTLNSVDDLREAIPQPFIPEGLSLTEINTTILIL
ncbi:12060_t:CDS:2 [Funneliformis geosporum]|uniref:9280_t:CDS:1 n=1 Tax=Funneliformis geosporum TaxID=1117311 RepID=A0A9W4SWG0_9GLOM|nr:9280_t:CDS:2 [Funneliformis geosporum]CAI2186171.1 12060_t:CDS:2 [Funneliformis geosporum]